MARETRMIGLRVEPPVLERIDAEARKRGLTRTDLLIRAALGELDQPPDRLAAIEARLTALERGPA